MRKIIVLTFVTLDGIMQAPGGTEEDKSNSFPFGGWSVDYWDDVLEKEMSSQMGGDFELLLGRKTYDGFSSAWPIADPDSIINKVKKYVVTKEPLPRDTNIWQNSVSISGDIIKALQLMKKETGPDLHVHGSSKLVQLLLKHGLVDEIWLKTYPIVLGTGKRLFGNEIAPSQFNVRDIVITPKGVILAKYIKEEFHETIGTVNSI